MKSSSVSEFVAAVVVATLAWMCWVIADIGDEKDDEE